MAKKIVICGIDFGAKLAGTTSICFEKDCYLEILQSKKKKDADKFISDFLNEIKPKIVFIDAPLSLPGVYKNKDAFKNYFYRKCDLDAKAMSPMFIGGLTARAIRLKDSFQEIQFFETYPKLSSKIYFGEDYKKLGIDEINDIVEKENFLLKEKFINFHQIDSFLAFQSAKRYLNGNSNQIGNEEGYIYF